MRYNYLKNYAIHICTYHLCALLLFLGSINVNAQSCECTNCPDVVGPLSNSTFEFFAEGATNNDLSLSGQGVCGVEIDFIPDHIWSLEMTLTSPGGQSITLIGSQSFQIGFTGPLSWDIDFVPCGDVAMPDPGFNDVWDNNQNWIIGTQYSGAYYPHIGCLEDFNTGTVDGSWILTVDNSHPLSDADILDFRVVFCDDEGLGCFECGADAGTLNTIDEIKSCQSDSVLVIDLFPEYTGTAPDTLIYGYTYVITQEDTIVGYESIPSLIDYGAGDYQVCGMSYLLEDSTSFPAANNTITLTTLVDNLTSSNPAFCGAITSNCLIVGIQPVDTTLIIDTICLGDTLYVDTLALSETGIYQLDYFNEFDCDSILIIDLLVQGLIISEIEDSACAEEPYFFNDMWLVDDGEYADTLLTTAGCDSFVVLKFFRLDTIQSNQEAVICKGDSFQIGDTFYDTLGIHTTVLSSMDGCDSTVTLNLIVLDPQIIVAPIDTLDCSTPSSFIDASSSLGEALVFQWTDIVNGGAGIISGVNSPVLEVSLPGNYLLTLTDTLDGNQCDTSAIFIVTTDYSLPVIDISNDTINCLNPPVQLEVESFTEITGAQWNGPDDFSSSDIEPFITLPGDYEVIITGSNGCQDTFFRTIESDTITPVIQSAGVSDTLSCDIVSVQLTGVAVAELVTYQWDGPGGFDSNAPNPTTSSAGDYIFSIIGENGCISDTLITVYENVESPDVQIDIDTLGCAPDTIQLFSTSSISGSTFSWLGPNTFESEEQNPMISEGGFYGLTVEAPNGCSITEFVNIPVDTEEPQITIIGDTLGCTPDTILLQSFSSINNSTFDWSGPGGFISNLPNPEVSEIGTYTLEVTAPNGCQNLAAIEVVADTVPPIVNVLGDTLGCLPDTIILEGISNINGSLFQWNGPGGFSSNLYNPEVTIPGSYDLNVIAPNGCLSTNSYEVEINNELPLVTIESDTLGCAPDTIMLESFSSITDSNFEWTGPSGFTSSDSNPEITEAGFYELTVQSPNGCETINSVTVEADTDVPIVTIESDTLGCAPDTIMLESFSSITDSNFEWTGPSGFTSSDSNPEITEAGFYELTVQSPNGCETINSVTVEADTDVPIVTIESDTLNCAPDTIQLASFSSITGSSFDWTGPSGFTSSDSNPEITEAGLYELIVQSPNGCETISSVTVEADTDVPLVTIENDTLGCAPDTIILESFSSISGSSFDWTGPSGFTSSASNPEITEAGIYELTVQSPNGCETISNITVEADTDVPLVTIENDTLGCAPDTIILESFSSIAGSNFDWIGPSGFTSSASNPEITEAGLYELTVQSPNGCETISNITVEADTEVPVVTIENDTLGCAPDTIQLESFSSISGSNFDWTGPSGFTSSASNPEITEAGLYELTVQSPNGCETISNITVEADTEVPVVTIENDTLGCAPDTIQLESFSSISGSNFDWTGPSGFTSSASNPEITEAGLYELTVQSPNGCETISSVTVEADTEVPVVTIENDTLGCAPDTIQLESFSSIPGSSFDWMGPSGFTFSASNPEITEAGLYELTVQSPNGCETISNVTVEADTDVPLVTIENDTLGCAPDTIILESFSSIPGSSFDWTGPSGFTSSASNPEITEAGFYELTVQSPNGCETISSVTVEVDTDVPFVTIESDTLGCAPDTIILESFSNISGSSFEWTGPSGFTSSASNPEITEAGLYELTVQSPNGCETISNVTVEADTDVPFVTIESDTLGCAPDTIMLASFSSIFGSSYDWTGPSGFTSSASNPEITEAGIYELTVQSPNGCETISNVTVEADTDVPFVTIENDTLGCAPDTIMLASFSSITGSSFEWTGPSGFTSSASNPEITEAGFYELTVQSPNGCETISSVTVEVDTDVPFVTIESDTLGCAPDTIILESFSNISGSSFDWTGPSGFTSSASNPEITEAGIYELTVQSPNGCETISNVTVEADTDVPLVTIESDTLGCAPDTIMLESFSSIAGSNFEWIGPSGFTSSASNPEITEAGLYELTVQSPNGCETISNITVEADTDVPFVTIENDTLGCAPDTIMLASFSSITGSSFEWTGPSGFTSSASNPEITEAGFYELTVQSPNGCETISSVTVEVDTDVPFVTIENDTLGCAPDTIILESFSSITGSSFDWTGPSGFTSSASNPEITEAGIYELTVQSPNGCETISSVTVEADTDVPLVTIESDTLGCAPDTIILESFSSIPGSSFEWTGPSGFTSSASNPEITVAGIYELTVQSPNGCETISNVTVEADTDVPLVTIESDTLGCAPDTIMLESFSSIAGSSYDWTGPGGFTSQVSNPEITEAGLYELTAQSPNGCETISSVTVEADTDVPFVTIENDTLGCAPDTIILESFSSIFGSSFEWTGPSGFTSSASNPEITEAGLYELTVQSPNGCETISNVTVRSRYGCTISNNTKRYLRLCPRYNNIGKFFKYPRLEF